MVDEQRLTQPFRVGRVVLSAINGDAGKETFYPLSTLGDVIIKSFFERKPTGWICPRCDTVKAPHVDECDCGRDLQEYCL